MANQTPGLHLNPESLYNPLIQCSGFLSIILNYLAVKPLKIQKPSKIYKEVQVLLYFL